MKEKEKEKEKGALFSEIRKSQVSGDSLFVALIVSRVTGTAIIEEVSHIHDFTTKIGIENQSRALFDFYSFDYLWSPRLLFQFLLPTLFSQPHTWDTPCAVAGANEGHLDSYYASGRYHPLLSREEPIYIYIIYNF